MNRRTKVSEERLTTFFKALVEDLANQYSLKGDDLRSYAVSRQSVRMLKRAKFVNPALEPKAISDFVALNRLVKETRISLDTYTVNNARAFITRALETYTLKCDPDDVQGVVHYDTLLNNWRFGPGASYGVKGTHVAEKLIQPMSCTGSALDLVSNVRLRHPYLSALDCRTNGGTINVRGSKLSTVPKNQDTVRTIAIEPSGNSILQLAAGRYLEDALRCVGLDIRTQAAKNKRLASHAHSMGLCTIDLKSASDMFKPDLVRLLLPPVWYQLLMRIRSHETRLPSGEWIELYMISTMGNGFTFPLMTLIITALIYANRCNLHKKQRPLYVDWSNTAVFGDDIIVPRDEYDSLTHILQQAGLIVNHDKSYRDGDFFESCGGDYYKGYDVTPFYVESLANDSEVYVAMNKVLGWCAKHELCLVRSLRYLKSLLRSSPFLVPEWEADTAGLRCSSGPRHYKLLRERKLNIRITEAMQPLLMSLACGGYVTSRGADVFYAPRLNKPKYVVGTSRIPKGFLDGWDPLSRSHRQSSWAKLMISLIS